MLWMYLQVPLLGAVTRSQPFMIVTEYMAGGSLSDVFKSGVALSNRRAIELALDCACGMSYLHKRRPHCIIHRDLKPANLMIGGHRVSTPANAGRMITDTGVVKIADFGLSRSIKAQLYSRHALLDLDHIVATTKTTDTMWSSDGNRAAMATTYKLTGELSQGLHCMWKGTTNSSLLESHSSFHECGSSHIAALLDLKVPNRNRETCCHTIFIGKKMP